MATAPTQDPQVLNYKEVQPSDFELPHNPIATRSLKLVKLREIVQNCGYDWAMSQCANGHQFAKQVLCGRDYCFSCGRRDSDAHKRRNVRTIKRARQLGKQGMGYFVIELQIEDRDRFRTQDALNKASRAVIDTLRDFGKPTCLACGRVGKQNADGNWVCPTSPKKHGIIGPSEIANAPFGRGIQRLHTHGEPVCPANYCDLKGHWDADLSFWFCDRHGKFSVEDVPASKMIYNPHWNDLVDAAWIDPQTLTAVQEALSWALVGAWDADLDANGRVETLRDGVILHYEYVPGLDAKPQGKREKEAYKVGGMEAVESYRKARYIHRAKYINHATLLSLDWDPDLAIELMNFRNTRYWGDWNQANVWELEETENSEEVMMLDKLQSGICPIDGTPLIWDKKLVNLNPNSTAWKPLGGGYALYDPGDEWKGEVTA